MLEVYNEPPPAEQPRRGWGNVIVVSILVGIGWLVFELTAQPALGAVLVCAKFGWNDLRTSWWLRRKDPHRRRGAACFWLYNASGLWNMAITGFVLMVAYVLVGAALNPQPAQPGGAQANPLLDCFIAAAMTWLIGFSLCGLAVARALWLSFRFRIKLWLSPQVHQARRDNDWPPTHAGPATNRVGILVITTLIVIYFPTMVAIFIALGGLKGRADAATGWFLLICFTITLLGPILILVFRDLLAKRMLARSPMECWGDDELVPADSVGNVVS